MAPARKFEDSLRIVEVTFDRFTEAVAASVNEWLRGTDVELRISAPFAQKPRDPRPGARRWRHCVLLRESREREIATGKAL
jgi:hypothetical protein